MKVALQSTSISFGLFGLLLAAAYILRLGIPYLSLIFSVAALILHSYFGFYLNLYNRSKTFDRIIHGFGAFSFAILFYYLFSNFLQYGGSRSFHAFYILLLGISLGAVYEIVEFGVDARQDLKLQRGLKDTNYDMAADAVGAAAASVFAYFILLQ
jgi:uncharacterized membrane protein YjdF